MFKGSHKMYANANCFLPKTVFAIFKMLLLRGMELEGNPYILV